MKKRLKVDDMILLTYKGEVYNKDVLGTTVIAVIITINYNDDDCLVMKVISDNSTGDSKFYIGEIVDYNLDTFKEFKDGSKNYKYIELKIL